MPKSSGGLRLQSQEDYMNTIVLSALIGIPAEAASWGPFIAIAYSAPQGALGLC